MNDKRRIEKRVEERKREGNLDNVTRVLATIFIPVSIRSRYPFALHFMELITALG